MSTHSHIRLGWIGAGGMARALMAAFARVGCPTLGIYTRDPSKCAHWQPDDSLWVKSPQELSERKCDVIFLSVPDAAIASVAQALALPNPTLSAHLSGTTPLAHAACAQIGAGYGVLYPVQSCVHGRPAHFGGVPMGIAANNPYVEQRLLELAARLGGDAFYAEDQTRQHIHLSATMAANFSNHILTQVAQYLQKHNLEFQRLAPLMKEVMAKVWDLDPKKAQTGPAIRHDHATIQQHKALLRTYKNPFLIELYDAFTQHIQATYPAKKD